MDDDVSDDTEVTMRGTRAVLTGAVTLTAALALFPAAATATTTPAAHRPVCSTSNTRVTAELGQAASGQDAIAVHLTATAACVTSGYPAAAVLDAAGTQVGTATREPRGYFGGLPAGNDIAPRVTLQPGQEATALVEFTTRSEPDGGSCPSWSALRVTLPHNSGLTTLRLRYTACTTSLTVNPVLPGATGRG